MAFKLLAAFLLCLLISTSAFNPSSFFVSRAAQGSVSSASVSRGRHSFHTPKSCQKTLSGSQSQTATTLLAAPDKDKELTPPLIAEMLEKTFVDACMQLSSGYVDVLKLFIVAGKAAYERGLTIPQVQLEISQCKTQTAGRPLMQEEIDLRTVWLSLVYLTLEVRSAHAVRLNRCTSTHQYSNSSLHSSTH